jgi:hypothetical protein
MAANLDNTVFIWNILNYIAYPTYETYEYVVFSIMWKYIAEYTDSNGKIWTSNQQFVTSVNVNNITNFVPFNEITLDMTIQWITPNVDIPGIQLQLLNSINNQISPPAPTIVVLPPPF